MGQESLRAFDVEISTLVPILKNDEFANDPMEDENSHMSYYRKSGFPFLAFGFLFFPKLFFIRRS
jgi:hypothetical protein